jgi:hypothetical protein
MVVRWAQIGDRSKIFLDSNLALTTSPPLGWRIWLRYLDDYFWRREKAAGDKGTAALQNAIALFKP